MGAEDSWIELCLQKSYIQVLTLSVGKYDLMWNEVFTGTIKSNQVKMRSDPIRVGLQPVTCVVMKERRGGFGHRDTGAHM